MSASGKPYRTVPYSVAIELRRRTRDHWRPRLPDGTPPRVKPSQSHSFRLRTSIHAVMSIYRTQERDQRMPSPLANEIAGHIMNITSSAVRTPVGKDPRCSTHRQFFRVHNESIQKSETKIIIPPPITSPGTTARGCPERRIQVST